MGGEKLFEKSFSPPKPPSFQKLFGIGKANSQKRICACCMGAFLFRFTKTDTVFLYNQYIERNVSSLYNKYIINYHVEWRIL